MFNGSESKEVIAMCNSEEIVRILNVHVTYMTTYIALTVSMIAILYKGRHFVHKIQMEYAQLTVIIIGAGPVGLTAALISVNCKRIRKCVLYEEQSRQSVEQRSYQLALQSSQISMLKKYGVDFDNLEGLWHNVCFYTRAGIYLEYLMHLLPLCKTEVDIKFETKFTKEMVDSLDKIAGRKLIICCDGFDGFVSQTLGLSDKTIIHSSGIFGAVAVIDRKHQVLVPIPEKRVHNLSFDLSAYGLYTPEFNEQTKFTLKIFGNSQCRHMALAVNRCDSGVVKKLKSALDQSMMRNIFLKCYNTYKRSYETSISDSYCLHNMSFSPRLYEIKLSQRVETTAFVVDCDMFIITEGEAARSYNYNTGLEINMSLNGLSSLQQFIEEIRIADTEHAIVKSLVFKMKHSEEICRECLTFGLKKHLFS